MGILSNIPDVLTVRCIRYLGVMGISNYSTLVYIYEGHFQYGIYIKLYRYIRMYMCPTNRCECINAWFGGKYRDDSEESGICIHEVGIERQIMWRTR